MTVIQLTPQKPRFTAVLREDQATDGAVVWVAEYPDLPGCMSHGETREEAMQNLQEAAELYLETLREQGRETPTPKGSNATLGTGFAGAHVEFAVDDVELDLEIRQS